MRKLNVIELAAVKGVQAELQRAHEAVNQAQAKVGEVLVALGLKEGKGYRLEGDCVVEILPPQPTVAEPAEANDQ